MRAQVVALYIAIVYCLLLILFVYAIERQDLLPNVI
jgi:hypothetical protein